MGRSDGERSAQGKTVFIQRCVNLEGCGRLWHRVGQPLALVLAGTPPTHLLVKVRREIYDSRETNKTAALLAKREAKERAAQRKSGTEKALEDGH